MQTTTQNSNTFDSSASVVQYEALTIDFTREQFYLNGRPLHLTPVERKLLLTIAGRPDLLHRYEELQESLWGSSDASKQVRLHNYICRLRKKLRVRGWHPILTEQGRGYRFCPPSEDR